MVSVACGRCQNLKYVPVNAHHKDLTAQKPASRQVAKSLQFVKERREVLPNKDISNEDRSVFVCCHNE